MSKQSEIQKIIQSFDQEDLTVFVQELLEACPQTSAVDSLIHEWYESALAIGNLELEEMSLLHRAR